MREGERASDRERASERVSVRASERSRWRERPLWREKLERRLGSEQKRESARAVRQWRIGRYAARIRTHTHVYTQDKQMSWAEFAGKVRVLAVALRAAGMRRGQVLGHKCVDTMDTECSCARST